VPRVVGHSDDSDVLVMFHVGLQFSTGQSSYARPGLCAFQAASIAPAPLPRLVPPCRTYVILFIEQSPLARLGVRLNKEAVGACVLDDHREGY